MRNSFTHLTRSDGNPSTEPWTSLFLNSQVFQSMIRAVINVSGDRCSFKCKKSPTSTPCSPKLECWIANHSTPHSTPGTPWKHGLGTPPPVHIEHNRDRWSHVDGITPQHVEEYLSKLPKEHTHLRRKIKSPNIPPFHLGFAIRGASSNWIQGSSWISKQLIAGFYLKSAILRGVPN